MNCVCVCVCSCVCVSPASDSFNRRMCSIKTHTSAHPVGQDGLLFLGLSKIADCNKQACITHTHTQPLTSEHLK